VEFFSNPSAIYTKWCAQTLTPILGLFAIFDRNFAKILAPPPVHSDRCIVTAVDMLSIADDLVVAQGLTLVYISPKTCREHAHLHRHRKTEM